VSGRTQNPWADLPLEPPYLAPSDGVVMERHPQAYERLRLDLLPYPYQGARDAEVLLLLANPGAGDLPSDYPAELLEERRRALTFTNRVDPRFATETWWTKRMGPLIDAVGEDRVSRGTLSLEYFPYHSRRYRRFPELLPSQQYTFDLVREAIRASRLIVVVRQKRAWLEAVPELAETDYVEVKNPQSAYISPGNLRAEDFARLVTRLRGLPDSPDPGSRISGAPSAQEPAAGDEEVAEGTFLAWIDPGPNAKPLGMVVPAVSDDMVSVLMADEQGNTDLEVFVARPQETGVTAPALVRESMRVVEPPEDSFTDLLTDLAIEEAVRAESERRADSPPLDSTPVAEPVEGFCVKERKTVRIKQAQRIMMTDGRPAIEGTCPDCGTLILKLEIGS
jgi:hypothetical protein